MQLRPIRIDEVFNQPLNEVCKVSKEFRGLAHLVLSLVWCEPSRLSSTALEYRADVARHRFCIVCIGSWRLLGLEAGRPSGPFARGSPTFNVPNATRSNRNADATACPRCIGV